MAVASRRIENDSIASGGMLLSIWLVISTPSRISSGDLLAPKVEMPRIQKFAPSAPGSPDDWVEMTPAILPANEVERLLDVTLSVLGRTTCTAPTKLSFFCVPKATTTTSSMTFDASISVTSLNSSTSATAIFLVS